MPNLSRKKHPDHDIYIERIRRKDQKIFAQIYQELKGTCCTWAMSYNATKEESIDVFHDTILVIIENVVKDNFILVCPFGGYFTPIYKRLWFKKFQQKCKEDIRNKEIRASISKEEYDTLAEKSIRSVRLTQLIADKFKELSPLCQRILKMYIERKKAPEIAIELDMTTNAVYARKKGCTERWEHLIQNDINYNDCKPL